MNKHDTERAMHCECNGMLVYPKISPCIIVLVTKEDDLLLAHNKNFPGKFYSTLAGFIEPGETAEDAIHREVEEEVSIRVKNIKYYGSQSWPFPSQLMLGYHAEYESGEIQPDGEEIDEADWFNHLDLPAVPTGNISISGRLIEHFLDSKKNN
jgi:NAD+ diphosphatase